jgi:hypothetical protein
MGKRSVELAEFRIFEVEAIGFEPTGVGEFDKNTIGAVNIEQSASSGFADGAQQSAVLRSALLDVFPGPQPAARGPGLILLFDMLPRLIGTIHNNPSLKP